MSDKQQWEAAYVRCVRLDALGGDSRAYFSSTTNGEFAFNVKRENQPKVGSWYKVVLSECHDHARKPE